MGSRAHVLVLNHNGRKLLEACLPSVVECARGSATPCRVTVVDNESTDDSAEYVRSAWQDVGWMPLKNQVLVSFNEAVRRVHEPVVLLLNNDVKLAAGCIDHLVEPFETTPDCFLTAPLCWGFDGSYEGARCELRFRRGFVTTRWVPHQRAERKRADAAPSGLGYTACSGAEYV